MTRSRPVVEHLLYNSHELMQRITAAQNVGTRNQRNRVARSIQLDELIHLVVDLQQIEGGVDVADHVINLLYEHRGIRLRECGPVIETPVVVHALGDREDLILQRVGVVTDNAELDGRDRHSWYAFFPIKKLAIRFTVFETWYSVLCGEMSDDHLEELHEITSLGGLGGSDIFAKLLDVLGVSVKLYRIDDFVHPLAEHGIVDVIIIIINEAVGQHGNETAEFVQS